MTFSQSTWFVHDITCTSSSKQLPPSLTRDRSTNAASADLKHKTTQDSWWLSHHNNPGWVQEAFQNGGSQAVCVKSYGDNIAAEGEAVLKHAPQDARNEAVTLVAALQQCVQRKDLCRGSRIHHDIVSKGFFENYVFVGNALISMYARCGALGKAHKVFDELPVRNVVSWNALISGYTQHGHINQALDCFMRMQAQEFSPNAVTFMCILKVLGTIEASNKCQQIHNQIAKDGLLEKDVRVGTALLDMYAKKGLLSKAQELFNELPVRNVVSWTALIAGYVQHGYNEEALDCYEELQKGDCSPNAVTFLCILKACGSIGAARKGQELHVDIVRDGLMEENIVVGTALVDMYADCGMLIEAEEVFDSLLDRDVVAWNALLAGYAQLGNKGCFFKAMGGMIGEAKNPNSVTSIIVLNVCSHGGLVEVSQNYLEIGSESYGIIPSLEHYTCVVDLLGRAGHLCEAVAIIEKMPFTIGLTMWNTFLGACGRWRNTKLGRWAFEKAVQLDEKDSTTFIYMRNFS